MNIKEKLTIILTLSGLTQQQLADKLHVSFATVNSWINGKSQPRKGAQGRIDSLFSDYSGISTAKQDPLDVKKEIVSKKRRQKKLIDIILSRRDIHDQLVLSFTYHTNRIEGSTLTKAETASLLFGNTALSNKKLSEQLEAKNHQVAFEYTLEMIKKKMPITEKALQKLHGMLMNGICDDAGQYRHHAVRIVGANVPTANHLSISKKMKKLISDLKKSEKDYITHTAKIHATFEQIHPFSDGNGRIGRLLMLLMFMQKNIAPAVVRQERKRVYYRALQRAQQKQEFEPLENFICDAIFEGYKIIDEKR